MTTVNSADGTAIAFDYLGAGPPVILLAGAFSSRSAMTPLAGALQESFTIINCDRRGRGESGDTQPHSVMREIEDVEALIAEAGGSATVFGHSSGATLALKAAAHGLQIAKLALYEPALHRRRKPSAASGGPARAAQRAGLGGPARRRSRALPNGGDRDARERRRPAAQRTLPPGA